MLYKGVRDISLRFYTNNKVCLVVFHSVFTFWFDRLLFSIPLYTTAKRKTNFIIVERAN